MQSNSDKRVTQNWPSLQSKSHSFNSSVVAHVISLSCMFLIEMLQTCRKVNKHWRKEIYIDK